MLSTLSSLGLATLAAVSVALPVQDSSPEHPPAPASSAQADSGGGLPSAYAGMAAGMGFLEEWGAGRCFDLVGVDSRVSSPRATQSDVHVDFEVRVYGQSPADARAAFLELEKALARRAAEPLQASMDVSTKSKNAWNPSSDHSLLASKAVRECFASVHLGTAQLTLSAELSPIPKGKADISGTGMSYIRSVATQPEVQLGPVAISNRVDEAMAWRDKLFHVKRSVGKGTKPLSKRQLVNFLIGLETSSQQMVLSSLSFDVEEDKSITGLELTLTNRVAKEQTR